MYNERELEQMRQLKNIFEKRTNIHIYNVEAFRENLFMHWIIFRKIKSIKIFYLARELYKGIKKGPTGLRTTQKIYALCFTTHYNHTV